MEELFIQFLFDTNLFTWPEDQMCAHQPNSGKSLQGMPNGSYDNGSYIHWDACKDHKQEHNSRLSHITDISEWHEAGINEMKPYSQHHIYVFTRE